MKRISSRARMVANPVPGFMQKSGGYNEASSCSCLATFLQAPMLRSLFRPFRWRRPKPVCSTTIRSLITHETDTSHLRTPYDLVHFRRSRFAAHINELNRRDMLPPDAERDPLTRMERALSAAGQAHEVRVIEHIRALIPSALLCEIPFGHPDRFALTEAAILDGKPLIAGAALRDEQFSGYADLLIHSSVDPFCTGTGYAVCEIKLASLQTADFALQAAAYAVMLNSLQRRLGLPTSSHAYLWLGSPENRPRQLKFRTLDYFFRRVSQDYQNFLTSFSPTPLPQPDAPLEQLGPWKNYASFLLDEADSLRLIAGIRRSQAREIEAVTECSTLAGFAQLDPVKLDHLIRNKLLSPLYQRLHRQARMQYATHMTSTTAFEKVDPQSKGMPLAHDLDVYFDMEGFPLVEGGLEYLFGVSNCSEFRSWWAHTRIEEEEAFVRLISYFSALLDSEALQGQPHIFHYGHYEVTALHRVAMRAVTREGLEASQTFERFLERGVFFDVYDFVRTSLVIGEPSYSIKNVEKLVGVSREGDELADAESSVGMYYEWRCKVLKDYESEPDQVQRVSHPILDDILHYNRQDCESLKEVVAWLRSNFPPMPSDLTEVNHSGADKTADSESDVSEEIVSGACGRTREDKIADSAVIKRSAEVSLLLCDDSKPTLPSSAKQNVPPLLHFYVRESFPVRLAFRRRVEAARSSLYDDLLQDDKCISGVQYERDLLQGSPGKEKTLHVYNFDTRESTQLATGESVAFVSPDSNATSAVSTRDGSDAVRGFMTVKNLTKGESGLSGEITLAAGRKFTSRPPAFGSLISTEDMQICDAPLRKSILRMSEEFLSDEASGCETVASAFLSRKCVGSDGAPGPGDPQQFSKAEFLRKDLADFLASQLDPNVFVIQGPPGSGKTFLSAHLIHRLVQEHKKTVAVSSNSHYAIDKLLHEVAGLGICERAIYKVGKRPLHKEKIRFHSNVRDLNISSLSWNDATGGDDGESECVQSPTKGHQNRKNAALVGGTCYQLSQEQCQDQFDFLFIDEASQVTVANFLAMSSCAKYAVLVGDQQQLEMPIKGVHPEQVSVSCLAYAVGEGVPIVQSSRGIFLRRSYRMNPDICEFISESFYDNELTASDICVSHKVHMKETNGGLLNVDKGICFVPCDSFVEETHSATGVTPEKWHAPAEVAVLKRVVTELIGSTFTTSKLGPSSHQMLSEVDILVVAPYNAQVRALKEALPEGIRIGTVDKFQGQEAPVVLVSTCANDLRPMNSQSFQEENSFQDEVCIDGDFSGIVDTLSSSQRRGLKFALRRNRLNVAISRAQCLAVVTGHSTACSAMSLNDYEDIETAALYEHLQNCGVERK